MSKKKLIFLILIIVALQFFDCLTTKIMLGLSGETDVESNPLLKIAFGQFGWGMEYLFLAKMLVVGFFCWWFMRYRESKFWLYDLMVYGIFIFGFLFVVLNNAVMIALSAFLVRFALALPDVAAGETINNIYLLANHLVLGIFFSIIGVYVWRRHRRTFCFGPVFVCFWVIVFTAINLFTG